MKKASVSSLTALLILGLLLVSNLVNEQLFRVQAATDDDLGARLYLENCATCHGKRGDGKGPEASRLKIKPRDFTTGNYKFRSTPSGSLPLEDDIFKTISRGIRGTSMLAQLHLSDAERWALVKRLKLFSQRFRSERRPAAIEIPPMPAMDSQLVDLGKFRYQDAGCAECHGRDGKGDGPSGKGLTDESGRSIFPADLTMRPFKSGLDPADLYRTLSTGLNGTPMPSYADALPVKERWAVVAYILSIATRERPRGMMGLVGEEVQGMQIDMRAAMAGMMKSRGMMGRGGGMMDKNMHDRK